MTEHADLERADALLELHRAEEALPLLARAIAADPSAARPHCLLALALLEIDRTGDALDAARQASAAEPDDEWALRLQALALSRRHRPRSARRLAEAAVRLHPTAWETHVTLAALLGNRRLPAARAAAAEAVRLAPERAETHAAASSVALRQSRWSDAEAMARRALAIDPTDFQATTNLALALQGQGRGHEAVDVSLAAAQLHPNSPISRRTFQDSVVQATKPGPLGLIGALVCSLALAATRNTVVIVGGMLLLAVLVWRSAVRSTRLLRPDAQRVIALQSRANRSDPIGALARDPGAGKLLAGCGAVLCLVSPPLLLGPEPVALPFIAVLFAFGAAALAAGLAAIRRSRR